MSNELTNWIPFNTKTSNSKNFEVFIDAIKELDTTTSPDLWVKWKDSSSQLVVGTENYFYKLYMADIKAGEFFAKAREELAKIYNELYGIHWYIRTFYYDNQVFQIEQREPLQVCDEKLPFDKILLGWNKTLELLEEKLLLNQIFLQIKDYFPKARALKLVRDCMNKHIDYALDNNGNIILLDDADWFLALVDEEGKWLNYKSTVIDIISPIGESFFAPSDFFEFDGVTGAGELSKYWNIYLPNEQMSKSKGLEFMSKREQLLANNIKILTTNKYNDEILLLEK